MFENETEINGQIYSILFLHRGIRKEDKELPFECIILRKANDELHCFDCEGPHKKACHASGILRVIPPIAVECIEKIKEVIFTHVEVCRNFNHGACGDCRAAPREKFHNRGSRDFVMKITREIENDGKRYEILLMYNIHGAVDREIRFVVVMRRKIVSSTKNSEPKFTIFSPTLIHFSCEQEENKACYASGKLAPTYETDEIMDSMTEHAGICRIINPVDKDILQIDNKSCTKNENDKA